MKPRYIVFTFFDEISRRKMKVSDGVTIRELSRIEDFCHQKILEIGKKKHEKRKKMRWSMAINSRQKGARYERELAADFRAEGYDARRGQQFSGANGDADVVGLPGIHVEAKRVEHLNIHNAMDQAVRDAREEELPAVFHRKNNCETLVTMRLADWFQVYREWEAGKEVIERWEKEDESKRKN